FCQSLLEALTKPYRWHEVCARPYSGFSYHGGKAMDARMPQEFFEDLEPLLPPERKVGPQGGRPAIDHRTVMKVIWFVLCTGCRWQDVPQEMGCSGRTAHRRLRSWAASGVWDQLHMKLLRWLRKAKKLDTSVAIIDSVLVRAFGGGDDTGPSPVDRAKTG